MVSTETGFPPPLFHLPAFWSVKGGLGGAFGEGADLEGVSLSLDAFRSVAGGVKTLSCGRGPMDSLLCSLEKPGYGRLDLDSDLSGESSSLIPLGIEERRLVSTGDSDVREDVFSRVELLRCEEDLCFLSDRSLSCLKGSLRSLRRSGLFSRILDGMSTYAHDARPSQCQSGYCEAAICCNGGDCSGG